jgi:hypothetical protein
LVLKEALAFKESEGNTKQLILFGYMEVQFGTETLRSVGYDSSLFLRSPRMQERALCFFQKTNGFYKTLSRNTTVLSLMGSW